MRLYHYFVFSTLQQIKAGNVAFKEL